MSADCFTPLRFSRVGLPSQVQAQRRGGFSASDHNDGFGLHCEAIVMEVCFSRFKKVYSRDAEITTWNGQAERITFVVLSSFLSASVTITQIYQNL
jgi:hypothetical protein